MGDWADMILNGDLDEVTGEYIGEGDGYPRTLTNGNNSYKRGFIYRQSEAIINHFQELKTKVLDQCGLNIYLPEKIVITVWWQKNKYCINGKWKYFADPSNADKQLIAIIEGLLPNKKTENITVENNVQKCIDHILNKAKLIGTAKGADHATATMLKTVALELEQYL